MPDMARFNGQALTPGGSPISTFQVEVRTDDGNVLASIFSDRDGSTPLANPFTPPSIDNGHFFFHAAGGTYKVRVFTNDGDVASWRWVAVGTMAEHDAADYTPTSGLGDLAFEDNASGVPFTPVSGISATNVQAAIAELQLEKEPADATIIKEADVTGGSVTIVSSQVRLSGDNASPGNLQYYGTNNVGTKGFFTLPSTSPAPAWFYISSAAPSNAATLDINLASFVSTYNNFRILLWNWIPTADDTILCVQTSPDGTNYSTGASDYSFVWKGHRDDNTEIANTDDSNANGQITDDSDGMANGAHHKFTLELLGASQAVQQILYSETGYTASGGRLVLGHGTVRRNAGAGILGVRLFASSGNISGIMQLYGGS